MLELCSWGEGRQAAPTATVDASSNVQVILELCFGANAEAVKRDFDFPWLYLPYSEQTWSDGLEKVGFGRIVEFTGGGARLRLSLTLPPLQRLDS